jgi:hypothetical protein
MTGRPQTDHEWTIHSLNIHGIFFERWCRKIIRDSGNWGLVSRNYPVAYKPLDSQWPWKESELDLRALHGGYQGRSQNRRHLTLLIECKKNNPDLKEWIFFSSEPRRLNYFPCVETVSVESHLNECSVRTNLLQSSLDLPVTESARETRGSYLEYQAQRNNKNAKDITKTSNDAITKAAQQVALATQAIVTEEVKLGERFGRFNPEQSPTQDKHVFLPTVVTTANLFVCEFEDKDVDGSRGEIAYDRAHLTPSPCVVYRMSLPPHLQRKPEPSVKEAIMYGSHEVHTRMDILVVNSAEFGNFLQRIPDMMSHAL